MKWILMWFNRIVFDRFYRKVIKVEEAPYQDDQGARLVHELALECDHSFWCEIDKDRVMVIGQVKFATRYLCDACLLAMWVDRYTDNPEKALAKYNQWARIMKGVNRRQG